MAKGFTPTSPTLHQLSNHNSGAGFRLGPYFLEVEMKIDSLGLIIGCWIFSILVLAIIVIGSLAGFF